MLKMNDTARVQAKVDKGYLVIQKRCQELYELSIRCLFAETEQEQIDLGKQIARVRKAYRTALTRQTNLITAHIFFEPLERRGDTNYKSLTFSRR